MTIFWCFIVWRWAWTATVRLRGTGGRTAGLFRWSVFVLARRALAAFGGHVTKVILNGMVMHHSFMLKTISKLVNHQFSNIVHKLLPVVLLAKPQLIHLLDLIIPEVAHHRPSSLLLPHQLQPLVLSTSQIYRFWCNFDSDVRFGTTIFLWCDKHV